jgi:hypothetical protein
LLSSLCLLLPLSLLLKFPRLPCQECIWPQVSCCVGKWGRHRPHILAVTDCARDEDVAGLVKLSSQSLRMNDL